MIKYNPKKVQQTKLMQKGWEETREANTKKKKKKK